MTEGKAVPQPPTPLRLVFDASALVAWVLQTAGQWQKVHTLFSHIRTEGYIPASALAETIYICQLRGNTASGEQLTQALVAQSLEIESLTEEDAIVAAELIAESRRSPVEVDRNGKLEKRTLSLGDGLVLATALRLQATAVSFDETWKDFPFLAKIKIFSPARVT